MMWASSTSTKVNNFTGGIKNVRNGVTAIAIDKDKSSQYALRWTVQNLLTRGQTVILIHVLRNSSSSSSLGGIIDDENSAASGHNQQLEQFTNNIFLSFHCFGSRKEIQCYDVLLEDSNIAKAITDYVAYAAIEQLVLGSSRHGFIKRLKTVDIPTSTMKLAPDFCTVYVISKTKIASIRNASRPAPFTSPLFQKISEMQEQVNGNDHSPIAHVPNNSYTLRDGVMTSSKSHTICDDADSVRSTFSNTSGIETGSESSFTGSNRTSTDMSFTSSNRLSTDISFISPNNKTSSDRLLSTRNETIGSLCGSRLSASSVSSVGSERPSCKSSENSFMQGFSSTSVEDDDTEAEMRRLKLELQKTMELYSTACKEALSAKEMATELHHWRIEEERKHEEAKHAAVTEGDRTRTNAGVTTTDAASRIADMESRKRVQEEMKAMSKKESSSNGSNHRYDCRYRRYNIEEIEQATGYFNESNKIGEGGYGPVFKCRLDHTTVAVKILRPDANQGKSQFNQEIDVLSCMRHPHLVLLLGACPEYGCLVYEYMANGSLEDRLYRRGNTPPLSWQLRFRIAAEIATGLLFLHRTKPEPLVHRDLKPANILLDQNFVSKISDVGLARLVPPSVADDVTQYRMTSAAGTFCYIDPEYQQTGMLGVKSDVYSYGIILLQMITAKPAMGITHHVQAAIDNGKFENILDDNVKDWPVHEALSFAKLGLQCGELRRKDRPDLGKYVLPELNRLRDLAEETMTSFFYFSNNANGAKLNNR